MGVVAWRPLANTFEYKQRIVEVTLGKSEGHVLKRRGRGHLLANAYF